MLFNVMLTRKCFDMIIWGKEDPVFWQSCVSGAAAVVILLFLVNIGLTKLFPYSFLIPLLIIILFIGYNAIELALWISVPGNNVQFTLSNITMTRSNAHHCTINYLNVEELLAPNVAEA